MKGQPAGNQMGSSETIRPALEDGLRHVHADKTEQGLYLGYSMNILNMSI